MKKSLVLFGLLFAIGIVISSARLIETDDNSKLTLDPSIFRIRVAFILVF